MSTLEQAVYGGSTRGGRGCMWHPKGRLPCFRSATEHTKITSRAGVVETWDTCAEHQKVLIRAAYEPGDLVEVAPIGERLTLHPICQPEAPCAPSPTAAPCAAPSTASAGGPPSSPSPSAPPSLPTPTPPPPAEPDPEVIMDTAPATPATPAPATPRICLVPGCLSASYRAAGLCGAHYNRAYNVRGGGRGVARIPVEDRLVLATWPFLAGAAHTLRAVVEDGTHGWVVVEVATGRELGADGRVTVHRTAADALAALRLAEAEARLDTAKATVAALAAPAPAIPLEDDNAGKTERPAGPGLALMQEADATDPAWADEGAPGWVDRAMADARLMEEVRATARAHGYEPRAGEPAADLVARLAGECALAWGSRDLARGECRDAHTLLDAAGVPTSSDATVASRVEALAKRAADLATENARLAAELDAARAPARDRDAWTPGTSGPHPDTARLYALRDLLDDLDRQAGRPVSTATLEERIAEGAQRELALTRTLRDHRVADIRAMLVAVGDAPRGDESTADAVRRFVNRAAYWWSAVVQSTPGPYRADVDGVDDWDVRTTILVGALHSAACDKLRAHRLSVREEELTAELAEVRREADKASDAAQVRLTTAELRAETAERHLTDARAHIVRALCHVELAQWGRLLTGGGAS